jgi:hypothetical protein
VEKEEPTKGPPEKGQSGRSEETWKGGKKGAISYSTGRTRSGGTHSSSALGPGEVIVPSSGSYCE